MTSEKASIVQVSIPANSFYCGKPLKAMQLTEKCQCLGLLRQGQVIFACENPTLRSGDTLVVAVFNPASTTMLKVSLKQTNPAFKYSLKSSVNAREDELTDDEFYFG